MSTDDPFDLQRFLAAQAGGVYEQALAELEAGEKRSHWMWFIFPQHQDLGHSDMAKFYGLTGRDEAKAYAAHPILGPRLQACVAAVESHLANGKRLEDILGSLDAMKYRSSREIFGR